MSLRLPVSKRDHIQGNPDAAIELVEYGDYQCPYCGAAYPEIKIIQEKMGNQLKFVFRNFPLTNMHEYALHAAIASEVAGDMGQFWEMHDMLFENQQNLDDTHLIDYAKELGLDIKKFEAKFPEPKYREKVEQDLESGLRSGVNGTPSFYVNGTKYQGDFSAEVMLEYLKSL